MTNKWLFFLALFTCSISFANDGAYYMSGNQLIPITENSISIKKEILSLKRVHKDYLEVTVDYLFYNPEKEAKTITVGFEAFSPEGDVDFMPKNGQHPYMYNFTVNLNQRVLPYEISYVDNTTLQEHKNREIALKDIENSRKDFGNADFYYVYHFNATFQPGNNRLVHTYTFDLSGSVDYLYDFEYILTAANRWANRQIDDFTLNLSMGDYTDFYINTTFFSSADEWTIDGIGKKGDHYLTEYRYSDGSNTAAFFMQKGTVQYKKKNFQPTGELFVFTPRYTAPGETFSPEYPLPFGAESLVYYTGATDENALKILQNLPYARRGYMFTHPVLKAYFEKMPWYIPNKNYIPKPDELNEVELRWLSHLQQVKITP